MNRGFICPTPDKKVVCCNCCVITDCKLSWEGASHPLVEEEHWPALLSDLQYMRSVTPIEVSIPTLDYSDVETCPVISH